MPNHNKHTLLVLTEVCLFWEEDSGKLNKPVFFKIESLKDSFFIIFEKNFYAGLNWRFLGNFIFHNLKIRKVFFQFGNKKSIRNTRNFFKSEIFFRKL